MGEFALRRFKGIGNGFHLFMMPCDVKRRNAPDPDLKQAFHIVIDDLAHKIPFERRHAFVDRRG